MLEGGHKIKHVTVTKRFREELERGLAQQEQGYRVIGNMYSKGRMAQQEQG